MGRFINHSCEPNCEIKDLFKIVATQDIIPGEEISWDYDTTEKNEESPWVMECKCGTQSCRKIIGISRIIPEYEYAKEEYKRYAFNRFLKDKPTHF